MKKKTIKSQLNIFYKNLLKEIEKRNTYWTSKSDSWRESIAGDNYTTKTDVLQELYDNLEDAVVNL